LAEPLTRGGGEKPMWGTTPSCYWPFL
jgi:hypothetical protein